MKKLIDSLLDKARKFTVMDYAFFKVALFSFGLIVGVYFATSLTAALPLFWAIFSLSYLYLIYRMFLKK